MGSKSSGGGVFAGGSNRWAAKIRKAQHQRSTLTVQRSISRTEERCTCPVAGSDNCRRWEGAAFGGLSGGAGGGLARFADHRPSQGARGDLSTGIRDAAATFFRFRRAAIASADPGRGAPVCQRL